MMRFNFCCRQYTVFSAIGDDDHWFVIHLLNANRQEKRDKNRWQTTDQNQNEDKENTINSVVNTIFDVCMYSIC